MNKVDLIWDSWDHISIKQSHDYKLNFEVKITLIFNSNFYHIKVFKFLNYLFWMKCPYILNVNLPRFFWYTYYSPHTSQLKYVESIWMTLYVFDVLNNQQFSIENPLKFVSNFHEIFREITNYFILHTEYLMTLKIVWL